VVVMAQVYTRTPVPELEDKEMPRGDVIAAPRLFHQFSEGGDLLQECEVHFHLGFDLDGFAVKQVGLVLPLFHSSERSRSQYRVSAD
jgi:hypothetical protein